MVLHLLAWSFFAFNASASDPVRPATAKEIAQDRKLLEPGMRIQKVEDSNGKNREAFIQAFYSKDADLLSCFTEQRDLRFSTNSVSAFVYLDFPDKSKSMIVEVDLLPRQKNTSVHKCLRDQLAKLTFLETHQTKGVSAEIVFTLSKKVGS